MSRLPLFLLLPVVLAQGARLRRSTPRLSAATPREGGAGATRLLVVGDSTAVGAGVTDMADAVAGRLGTRVPAAWRVVGDNGLRSGELLEGYLAPAAERPADLIVVLVGWNDALQLRSARSFARATGALLDGLGAAHPAARIALVAPPRFGRFAVFPQPLRWALGAHAEGLTRVARHLADERGIPLVPGFDAVHVASDRFHPDAAGYAALAADVAAALHLD
jgi:lysophospholipase L1-like esterase